MSKIDLIAIEDYRILHSILLDLGPINIFFGPNGSGKSTLLDALSFVRDFVKDGSSVAYGNRGGASLNNMRRPGNPARIRMRMGDFHHDTVIHNRPPGAATSTSEYLAFQDQILFERHGDKIRQKQGEQFVSRDLREPDRSAWHSYAEHAVSIEQSAVGNQFPGELLVRFIIGMRFFHSRNFDFLSLGTLGSETNPGLSIGSRGQGLWNCLRNLKEARSTNEQYQRIVFYLNRAFPEFLTFEFFQAGSIRVGCRIVEHGSTEISYPVLHAPDGLLQMAIVLAAMFVDGKSPRLVMLDEPDLSLHPWAIFVLSEAIKEAAEKWNCQLMLATHSPVLLSQLPEDSLLLMHKKRDLIEVERVSEMTENRDLLDQYAVGSLYMMQLIGEQSSEPMVHTVEVTE